MVSTVGLTVNGVCVEEHDAWPLPLRVPAHTTPIGNEPAGVDVNVTVPVGTTPLAPGTVAEYVTSWFWADVLGELNTATVVVPGATVIESACVSVSLAASVASTVKLNAPAVVGVPEIEPDATTVRPGGRVPENNDHVTPPTAPVALSPVE
jgi:hypothetical protein